MKLNGMTEMVMVEEIIQEVLLPMFVQMYQELHSDLLRVETDGAVMIQTVMGGPIKATNSHMSQLSGET